MRTEGYEVKRRGKSLEFRAPGQERFTRSFRLGEEYTEEALRERVGKVYIRTAAKTKRKAAARNVSLLVDIEAKMKAGKGKGYERWAKVFNLKEAARTLNFLTERGVTDYGELETRTEAAGQRFDALSVRIKQLEGRMGETAQFSEEYAALLAEKKACYEEYKEARKEMIDYQTAKQNVDRLLGLTESEAQRGRPERMEKET